ncbi:hypothetical protein PLANTIT3_30151 [Plantibacter sp. T3]|nr:hypothetical protein PLANTIT3_30151 [Plantibacter sp. T3]
MVERDHGVPRAPPRLREPRVHAVPRRPQPTWHREMVLDGGLRQPDEGAHARAPRSELSGPVHARISMNVVSRRQFAAAT